MEAAKGIVSLSDGLGFNRRGIEGEYYDHSGVACEVIQNETPLSMIRSAENGGRRWDLVEAITVNNNKERERGSMLAVTQEAREERENGWEDCNLAKFSQFFSFSTEGLEKEILNFLAKIRKRREKIYSRGALEKTKFERELKRLECSINYEGGSKQRSSSQDRGLLELLEWEEGQFSISCRFRKVEDGTVWVFTGVYGPFTKNERDCMWDEIGAIRGLWEEPWPVSDHFPVVLEGGTVRRGPSPFRFENMWLKVEGFQELIQSWWQGNRAAALQLVDHWDMVGKWEKTIRGGNNIKKEAKDSYAKWVSLEETHWRQHSRELWLGKGTKYRLLPSHGGCPSLEGDIERLQLEQLNQQEAENLEHPFSEEEIHRALMEMNGDKAPGPDEFTKGFGKDAGL
ncbi:hypothetical protein CK203_089985 [Vitis vinifera]|uniref:DUF4283 domain-containing protein n=1 Tax=Vitis vinifera TaxID=29760 RepID=A0A438BSJ4_VITVI|nr:hypothetical protein CK203_089985 [Vitis vinifera]